MVSYVIKFYHPGFYVVRVSTKANVYDLESQKLCCETGFKHFMAGEDSEHSIYDGNTVLVQLASDPQYDWHKYQSIKWFVFIFYT